MTRFVAALLIASGPAARAMVDPAVPGSAGLGLGQPEALLIAAHQRGRRQRAADDGLLAQVGAALRPVPGEDTARDAGQEAWRIHQQRGGGR